MDVDTRQTQKYMRTGYIMVKVHVWLADIYNVLFFGTLFRVVL